MNNGADNELVVFSSDAWKSDAKNMFRIYKIPKKGVLRLNDRSFSFVGDTSEVHFQLSLDEIKVVEFKTGNYLNVKTKTGKKYRVFLYDVDNADHGSAFPLTYKAVMAGEAISQKWISILQQYVPVDASGRHGTRKVANYSMIIGAVLGGIIIPLIVFYFYIASPW